MIGENGGSWVYDVGDIEFNMVIGSCFIIIINHYHYCKDDNNDGEDIDDDIYT